MRVVVVTTDDLAPGFRLAGAAVHAADDADAAEVILHRLLDEGERGVIAVHAPYFAGLSPAFRAKLESSLRPVVVPVPDGLRPTSVAERRARFAELLERAVGFHLVFEGGEGR